MKSGQRDGAKQGTGKAAQRLPLPGGRGSGTMKKKLPTEIVGFWRMEAEGLKPLSDNGGVTLVKRTRESCHAFYRGLVQDPMLFSDTQLYQPYHYDADRVDAFFYDREQQTDRIGFSVMLGDMVIGDVSLKHMDEEKRSCELEICMVNDSVKNKGYGTQAEKLAVQYAFEHLNMETVLADCLVTNTRSQRVLEKVGFQLVSECGGFRYYRMKKELSPNRENHM